MKNKPLIIGLVLLAIFFFLKSFLIPFLGWGSAFLFGPMAIMFFVIGLCYTGVGIVRSIKKTPEIEGATRQNPLDKTLTEQNSLAKTFTIIVLISLVIFFLGVWSFLNPSYFTL